MTDTIEVSPVNTEPSAVAADILAEEVGQDDYKDGSLYRWFSMSIEEIYENCLGDDEKYNLDHYIADLEAVVWGLVNQRAFLVNILHRIQEATYKRDENDPMSVMGLESLKKFILYCATGENYSSTSHNNKFYQDEQFRMACIIHPMLPAEWQERAAEFIETYASNYFETEFATSPPVK